MLSLLCCHECFVVFESVARSDADSALTALDYCVKQYSKAPRYSGILKLLIDAEDADRLQKGITQFAY